MVASNTRDCFRECIGKRVKGVLFDAMSDGAKTLIFEDGTGLTIASNGSFWRELSQDINRAIKNKRAELEANRRDIEDVLTAAGEKAA